MQSNRLLVNAEKTELIWCAPQRRRRLLPPGDLAEGDEIVIPVETARDLSIYVDGGLTMKAHVSHMVSSAFGALR